jgi:hypothetical protein
MGGTHGYAAIAYDPHARDRMRERRVSEQQVERVIANPTRRFPSTDPPGRVVAEYDTTAGNTLRVVYVEVATAGGTEALVLTVLRFRRRRR